MSIYKHMAGIIGTETIGGEDDDFDPHNYRVILHPTSYLDTMTHLLKGSIGAGILAMPHATMKLGIIYSAIILFTIGLFATFCIQLLISTQYTLCKRHRRGYMAYQKSMLFAIKGGPDCFKCAGKPLYWFVEITLVLWQLGICTIFFVFVARNTKQVLDYHGEVVPVRHLLVYILLPAIILNLVKDLKMLSPLSSASNLVTFVGLMLVAFYLIEDDLDIGPEKLQVKDWKEIPNFVGTALFALEAVGVVLALEYNMENPKQFVGLCGLFNIGMLIIISLYMAVGTFGYLKFGDEIKDSITLNLPENQKKAQVAKVVFALAIFMSFPLQNFVAYKIIWNRIKKKLGVDTSRVTLFIVDYLIRIFCVVLPWLLAVAVPQLGPFIALFGALCLSLLAMVFPAIMSLCVCYSEDEGYGPLQYKLIRDLSILIIGMLILVSGVNSSIKDIITSENSSGDFQKIRDKNENGQKHAGGIKIGYRPNTNFSNDSYDVSEARKKY